MKRTALVLALLFLLMAPTAVLAGEQPSSGRNLFALGYHLNNFRHDFGFGLDITSPYFWKGRAAVRFSANVAYFEGIRNGATETDWMPYALYKLGLVGVGGMINNQIRLYGEGGVIYAVPNSGFSAENELGGYGLFGFEFFMEPDFPLSYFIELGSVGAGARAEKIPGKPIYLNGFAATVGLRYHF